MFVLIVGCGRVGSSVAQHLLKGGHEVSVLDEDPEAHARLEVDLGGSWEDAGGRFTVGAGLEVAALTEGGIEKADGFVASTDGDNTNIVIAQIAEKRFNVPNVVARVLDPRRAEWYESQGLATISGTSFAIRNLEAQILGEPAAGGGAERVQNA
jgi:trk system potassium uptake protein TrkA